jgi:hypothetical protein
MPRRFRIALGTGLATLGLVGTLLVGPVAPVIGQSADSTVEIHQAMDAMMDAMHGPGTADRMHQIPGAEEMMDQCVAMMTRMGRGMMGGGMMGP